MEATNLGFREKGFRSLFKPLMILRAAGIDLQGMDSILLGLGPQTETRPKRAFYH